MPHAIDTETTRRVNDERMGLEGMCGPFRCANAAARRALNVLHYSVAAEHRFPWSQRVAVRLASERRPAGVLGAEVWVKLVDADTPAPTDPAGLTFLIMTTKPRFRAELAAGEGGRTAVYMAHWVNTRGEQGPWSEITTATVAA